MGFLEGGRAVPGKEGGMKVKLPPSGERTVHRPLEPNPSVTSLSRVCGTLPVRFHSLLFATEPRNSSKSDHFCQMVTGCLHQVIFLLRKFTDK